MKEKTFITITRQYGSGGVSIAEGIAKATGIKCYNRNIVAAAAESLDTFEDVQTVVEKSYDTPNDFVASLSALMGQGVPRQNQMYVQQARIIRELAEGIEGAVFVGRCADYILRDVPNHFSFFLYADDECRRERRKHIAPPAPCAGVVTVQPPERVEHFIGGLVSQIRVGRHCLFDNGGERGTDIAFRESGNRRDFHGFGGRPDAR